MRKRVQSNDEGWLLSYADLITNLLIFFAMLLGASDMNRARMQEIARELSGVEQRDSLSSIQKEIEKRIAEEGLQDEIHTDLTKDGLKLSLNSGLMFDSGSASIRVEQADVLDRMLKTLVPYAGRYDFAVEGHTDSTPFEGEGGRTNWDLSTDRANAVRTRLASVGVADQRIKVEGYADTVPLPEDDLDGLTEDEILARHRRVVVRVN